MRNSMLFMTFWMFVPALAAEDREAGNFVKPAPQVVQPFAFRLKVETKPRFPNENRPAASIPVVQNSLSVSIQPEKTSFAANGPLAFAVTFQNTSKSPLMLFGLEHLGVSPKLVIANQNNAKQWSLTGQFAEDKNLAAVELGPGESKTYTLIVEANPKFWPPVIPLPGPMPVPAVREKLKPGVNPQNIQEILVPPIRPPVIPPELPCGQGECRARLFLEFQTDPLRRYKHPTWTGKIASGPVDFQVGKAQPIVIPPLGGGPVTKDRAVDLAHNAAERALQANYRPVTSLHPPHQGAWISQPAKSANVVEKKTGSWIVSWTEFPKHGFSFNVKIEVSPSGAPTVLEVFTCYSD